MGYRRPPEVAEVVDLDSPPPNWLTARTGWHCLAPSDAPHYTSPPATTAEWERRQRERNRYLPTDIGRRGALRMWERYTPEQRRKAWERDDRYTVLACWLPENRGPHTVVAWCDDHDTTAEWCQSNGRTCVGRTNPKKENPCPTS